MFKNIGRIQPPLLTQAGLLTFDRHNKEAAQNWAHKRAPSFEFEKRTRSHAKLHRCINRAPRPLALNGSGSFSLLDYSGLWNLRSFLGPTLHTARCRFQLLVHSRPSPTLKCPSRNPFFQGSALKPCPKLNLENDTPNKSHGFGVPPAALRALFARLADGTSGGGDPGDPGDRGLGASWAWGGGGRAPPFWGRCTTHFSRF